MKSFLILLIAFVFISGCLIKIIQMIYTKKYGASQNNDINKENYENSETNTVKYNCSFIKNYRIVNKMDGYISKTNNFDSI